MTVHRWSAAILAALSLFTLLAAAMPVQASDIPPALQPWREWVLYGRDNLQCPPRYDDAAVRRCWWPSRLDLDVSALGGIFEQQVTVYAPTWVTLPGDTTHWPESVTRDNAAIPVVERDGRPGIWLQTGRHRIRGALVWDRLPDVLSVPGGIGMIALTVDGHAVDLPDLEAGGRLRLQGSSRDQRTEDTMTVSLFRLIADGIPVRVVTRALLRVAGRPREVRLADLLPEGAVVMAIDSPLPTRLTGPRELAVQVKPGRWDIRVTTRLDGPMKALSVKSAPYGEEIWSFEADNDLRMVKITGAPPLEPSRTDMPDAWKGYPAYLMAAGATLAFDTLRRGDPDPAPDQLKLERTWWLDFDGAGFTVHDRISGILSRSWHLAMGAPMTLGRVTVDGQGQLITRQGDPPSPGVQLRQGHLAMTADSRLPRMGSVLPAVGWDHDFQSVSGILHLPPGWTLFSAAGVDVPPGAWLQRWTLLDFFLVLIIAVSTYKIRGRFTGILALVTLALCFQEPGAPRLVWLHLLAVAALLKYLPRGWFRRLVQLWGAAAIIALVVIALPFMIQQIRSAVYPQLAPSGTGPILPGSGMRLAEQETAAPRPALMSKAMRSKETRTGAAAPSADTFDRQRFLPDPDALIQTGPGLPTWRWRSMPLRWNGPVDRSQQLRLWLISPMANLFLGVVRVLLLALLIAAFLDLRRWRRYLPSSLAGATADAAAAAIVILVLAAMPQTGHAEPVDPGFPPRFLLEDLQQRLTQPPPCFPRCADVSRLELAATPDEIRLILQAHAEIDTAIPLPVAAGAWRPTRVLIDNTAVDSLSRDAQGGLWMVLPQGVHQVKLIGPTGDAEEIGFTFPLAPHVGNYAGVGWQARGFRAGGGMASTIVLTRTKNEAEETAAPPKTDIPPFFQVTRTLHLGIQWEATTHIRRLTPPGSPALLAVPLLAGASLTTPGIDVIDGTAQIAIPPGQMETAFTSALPIGPRIELRAPANVPWSETWILDAGIMWRCKLSGLTPVHRQDSARNWQPQWQPWPGEAVAIAVSRPAAVPGRTVTIDRARLTLTPGERFARASLALNIRTSKGGQHQVELPEQANLQGVTVDGKSLPVRQDGRLVSIPLEPGTQAVAIGWTQLGDAGMWLRSPRVSVGDSAVNADVTVNLPAQRWILFAGGPRLGPAVLFWSYLIVVLIAAVGLGRTRLTPLSTGHWILLGLGLTQVPAPVAVVVVGWLLTLDQRCRREMPTSALAFDAVQVLLALLTLAALAGLYTAIERGLLGIPDMQIAGNGSTRMQFNWTQDRIEGIMPMPWVLSLPQWVYHLLMLLWALWLAFSLVAWLRWGWGCYSRTRLWQPIRWRRRVKAETPAAPPGNGDDGGENA